MNTFINADGRVWFHVCGMWTISPYDRCSFRCSYCNAEAQGESKPIADFKEQVERKVGSLGPEVTVGVGIAADAYPPLEAEHQLTRWTIERLTTQGVRFRIVTKGTLVLRDIDLLRGNPHLSDVTVSVSTPDPELVRRYEPGAPTYDERLHVAFTLHDAGVPVCLGAVPWIPNFSNAERIISDAASRLRVIFSAIDLGERTAEDRKVFGLRVVSSAQRVFGRAMTQKDVNTAYLREAARIGPLPNVWWLRPPGTVSPDRLIVPMNRADMDVLLKEIQSGSLVEPPRCASQA